MVDSGTIETALAERHRKNGAEMGVWFGCELPDRFGELAEVKPALQEEYRRLRESVGLVDKGYRAYLEFTGPDRVRYLNAILTNDIKGLQENHGTVSLFLNPQGHIQAEIETYAFGEKLFCVSYAMIRERLIQAMDKYIIMDDVTLTDRSEEYTTLAIEGPKAAAVALAVSGVELGSGATYRAPTSAMEELESREVAWWRGWCGIFGGAREGRRTLESAGRGGAARRGRARGLSGVKRGAAGVGDTVVWLRFWGEADSA
jgi:glycine cleavage system aminomethyltransferase T